ncbi:Mammalian cell entry related domain protein [Mycobacterium sp. TNTM28]|uniref:Mammalian cell entry related domain protein n=1 Tax=[Mycobacterium] fortunisiensis TaxID=2600579 RepID=A0ABS6KGA3_9MYCO|nr:Mammalian cell entry related domain protein [[Mycobacterium] fortunisiensis]
MRIGLALVACVAVAGALIVVNPLADGAADGKSITIDSPYVGQGVVRGTPVLLHGVKVGEVASVANRTEGGVRLGLSLQPEPTAGMTDSLAVDFRPSNYFGVTGVNLMRGPDGGRPLADGMRIELLPRGNFTMQALLSRLSEITHGVVTPELVSVLDRATRYVDGLNPMLETVLLVADTIAKVQTVSTAQLVRNGAGIAVAAPSFVDGLTDLADHVDHGGLDGDEQFFQDRFLATVQLASTGLFGAVGGLLSSHVNELLPVTEVVRTLTGPIPGIAQTQNISATLVELRTRFERMYGGSPDQRALQVRILLDSLPGVAAAVPAIGAPR